MRHDRDYRDVLRATNTWRVDLGTFPTTERVAGSLVRPGRLPPGQFYLTVYCLATTRLGLVAECRYLCARLLPASHPRTDFSLVLAASALN